MPAEAYRLGDELAFKAEGEGELLFAIGGKAQTEEDFQRQIAARFQGRFRDAWEEAVDYVSHFDRKTLLSGTEFFSAVYRPKRDEFAAKWTAMAESKAGGAPSTGSRAGPRGRSKIAVRAL